MLPAMSPADDHFGRGFHQGGGDIFRQMSFI